MSSIRFEHTIEIPQGTEVVFLVLDDVSRTPQWLARCTGIEKLTPGENAVGARLRYSYREGGRSGVMEGEITARIPNERLTFHYRDSMMDAVVDFRIARNGSGARLTHAIDIAPKTFFARLFAPMIRKQLPNQTITAMETLRKLLVSSS